MAKNKALMKNLETVADWSLLIGGLNWGLVQWFDLNIVTDWLGFIPYGEATDNGYHVPRFIYEQMKTRKFLQKRTKENLRNGNIEVKTNWVQEFALEELPPLTEKELAQLANQQRAAAGLVD